MPHGNPDASERVLELPPFTVDLYRGLSASRLGCEVSLAERTPLPLMQRSQWARTRPDDESWMLATRASDGSCVDCMAFEVTGSRSLPGHLTLRAEHAPVGVSPQARATTLEAVRSVTLAKPRILQVAVALVAMRERDGLEEAALLQAAGFRRPSSSRGYERTLVLDLARSEDEILAGVHRKARREIRAALRSETDVRTVTAEHEAPVMQHLAAETMARTGGILEMPSWPEVLRMSREHPNLSTVVGLYDLDGSEGGRMLAFAWGCFHGDHGQYYFGASTRDTEKKIGLGYVPLWELIRWSRSAGGAWFDLGGVTEGTASDGDRMGGISDFKRYFSTELRTVGHEFVLDAQSGRARVARAVSRMARSARRIRTGVGPGSRLTGD